MIYLDNAATSFPKPPAVRRAVNEALVCYGANPGRGGYRMAVKAAEQVYRCREAAARLFGLSDERRVVLTPGCTYSLNILIKSLLADGGRILVSDLEHNAVMRPLYALSERPMCYDIATVTVGDDAKTVQAFRRALTPHTRAIVCTQASNVTGAVLPIAALAEVAHERGIPIVVDAAQSAGHVPINMEQEKLDYVCAAGHKGLFGPMGTGLLLCKNEAKLKPLIEGGTGSFSLLPEQPADLPERLESGTPNVAGFCGLAAGIEWVERMGVESIAEYERMLCKRLYACLSQIKGLRLHSAFPDQPHSASVLSLTVDGMPSEAVGTALAKHGVAVRCGLHCAPAAHKAIGTLPDGTVRLSPGCFNTMQEMEICAQILKKIAANALLFAAHL